MLQVPWRFDSKPPAAETGGRVMLAAQKSLSSLGPREWLDGNKNSLQPLRIVYRLGNLYFPWVKVEDSTQ